MRVTRFKSYEFLLAIDARHDVTAERITADKHV